MELWWWVEPLFYTGLVTLSLAMIVAFLFGDSGGDWLFWVCIILLIPKAMCVIAVIVWFFSNVFLNIWKPYF